MTEKNEKEKLLLTDQILEIFIEKYIEELADKCVIDYEYNFGSLLEKTAFEIIQFNNHENFFPVTSKFKLSNITFDDHKTISQIESNANKDKYRLNVKCFAGSHQNEKKQQNFSYGIKIFSNEDNDVESHQKSILKNSTKSSINKFSLVNNKMSSESTMKDYNETQQRTSSLDEAFYKFI